MQQCWQKIASVFSICGAWWDHHTTAAENVLFLLTYPLPPSESSITAARGAQVSLNFWVLWTPRWRDRLMPYSAINWSQWKEKKRKIEIKKNIYIYINTFTHTYEAWGFTGVWIIRTERDIWLLVMASCILQAGQPPPDKLPVWEFTKFVDLHRKAGTLLLCWGQLCCCVLCRLADRRTSHTTQGTSACWYGLSLYGSQAAQLKQELDIWLNENH